MRRIFSSLLCLALVIAALPAEALDDDEDIDAYARVIVAETALRSGPGVSHRVVYRARRGETLLIQGREGSGFWLKVVLPDGRVGWLLGDTIEPVGAGPDAPEGAFKPGFFAPPALQEARGGFALMGGVIDSEGYVEIRPALVLAPAIAIEPYAGLALQRDGRRIVYGLGGTLNFAPDWAIAPFFHVGGGGLRDVPNDEFIRETQDFFHARAGGGLLISLRLRVLVRLEANNTVIFTEDTYRNVRVYYGGLGTYF